MATPFFLNRRWLQRILTAFCIILLSFVWLSRVNAQTAETEMIIPKVPVVLDGRELYKVGASGNFTAQERANTISALLQEKLDQNLLKGESVDISIQHQGNQTVLKVNGRYLVSITEADLMPGMMPQEQAEIWQEKVKIALEKSLRERSISYRNLAFKRMAIAFCIALGLQWFLFWLCRRYQRQKKTL
jgi:potassium efflux system protein